jgi:hypothetical protein
LVLTYLMSSRYLTLWWCGMSFSSHLNYNSFIRLSMIIIG